MESCTVMAFGFAAHEWVLALFCQPWQTGQLVWPTRRFTHLTIHPFDQDCAGHGPSPARCRFNICCFRRRELMDQVPVSAVFGFTLSNPSAPSQVDGSAAPAVARAGEANPEASGGAVRSGTQKMVIGDEKEEDSAAMTKRAATAAFNMRKDVVTSELELARAKSNGQNFSPRRPSNSQATEVVAPLGAIGPRNRGRGQRPPRTQQGQSDAQLGFSAPRVESGLMKMSL